MSDRSPEPPSAARRRVVADSLGVGVATGLYGVSFGALGTASGLSVLQTCVLSLVAFTGASQFAFIGVVAAGGAPSTCGPSVAVRPRRGISAERAGAALRDRPRRFDVRARCSPGEPRTKAAAASKSSNAAWWFGHLSVIDQAVGHQSNTPTRRPRATAYHLFREPGAGAPMGSGAPGTVFQKSRSVTSNG